MDFLNNLIDQFKSGRSKFSLIFDKKNQKDGVVGEIKSPDLIENKPDEPKIHDFDFEAIKKISGTRIVILIALLLGGIAIAAVLLWAKLTSSMGNYESSSPTDSPKQEEVKQSSSDGFLPGKTVVVEKKAKPEAKPKVEPEAKPEVKPDIKTESSPAKETVEPAPVVAETSSEHHKADAKPEVAAEHHPELNKIQLSAKHATGISQTINPQYLVENPILKTQKVVIVLKGFGLNKIHSDAVLDEIDEDIVVAVDPYSTNIKDEIDILKDFDLDVLVMIPLQDLDPFRDQGYLTIRTGMKSGTREKVLSSIFDVSMSSLGVLFTGGRGFLKSDGDVGQLVSYLSNHSRFVVLGDDVLDNKFYKAADAKNINYLAVIGNDLPFSDIDKILGIIRRTGFALLSFDINEPDVVLKINQWIKLLDENKIDVVSLSNLLKKND